MVMYRGFETHHAFAQLTGTPLIVLFVNDTGVLQRYIFSVSFIPKNMHCNQSMNQSLLRVGVDSPSQMLK